MRNIKKRGISPLVATVFLIGLAISLAILVWLWYGNVLKEQVEKQGSKSEAKSVCAREVEFRVEEACFKESLDPGVDNDLFLYLENKGAKIDDFRVTVFYTGETESSAQVLGDSLAETESKETSILYDAGKTIDKVVIMPVITRSGSDTSCTEQAIEIKPVNECP